MPVPSRRHRSSTAASVFTITASVTTELQPLIKVLHDLSTLNSCQISRTALYDSTQTLHRIRRILIDTKPIQQAQDAFRHLYGFQAVLGLLRSASGFYNPSASPDDKSTLFELLRTTLGLLSDALRDHLGNRRYFGGRVEGGGWTALEQAVASTGLVGSMSNLEGIDTEGQDQLFGCLFAFLLGEESLATMFTSVRRRLTKQSEGSEKLEKPDVDLKEAVDMIKRKCQGAIGGQELLRNSDILPTIFTFWLSLLDELPKHQAAVEPAVISVIVALTHLAQSSDYNLVAIHRSGILSTALLRLYDSSMGGVERSILSSLADTLSVLGLPTIKDTKSLFRTAISCPDASEFLLRALRSSKRPPFIQFDLSLHGYASIELPTMSRVFPPPPPSTGYTMATWIHVHRFDPKSHTTIFGAFDASQTCFVMAYIERDTHNFILQTSVTSSRPSVRFRSVAFKEKRWYHVALVHHRPRTLMSGKASLFVDGEFMEQIKCQYPTPPPPSQQGADQFPLLNIASVAQRPVQAFLGTPQDLASLLGKDVVFSRWALASFHLFDSKLSDDIIAVYYRLGPRYHGNFQDCLGSFMTYEASAFLNLRNESLHSGKEDKSDIVAAVRLKSSGVVNESHLLLSFSPSTVLNDNAGFGSGRSRLQSFLSRQAENNLHHYTHSGANDVAINCAIPPVNQALVKPNGVAIMTGEPIVMVPISLDDASWQVTGCVAICLKWVEAAKTREDVVRAVEILMEMVKDNWRNSEAMERQSAFGVLGSIIGTKMGVGSVATPFGAVCDVRVIDGGLEEQQKLSFELLSLVLGFVGYNHDKPEDSIIINPLAYRVLFVDFDMWRRTAPVTQRQYYKQFAIFGVRSRYRQYNSKRLFRMRIVRRFLDALKAESFSRDTFPDFLEAFRSLVSCNISAEVLRSLALFVTYALHEPKVLPTRPISMIQKSTASRARPNIVLNQTNDSLDPPDPLTPDRKGITMLSRYELGLAVLEIFTELLCGERNSAAMKKFARTITNKWLLYLFAEQDARVNALARTILTRVMAVQGETFVSGSMTSIWDAFVPRDGHNKFRAPKRPEEIKKWAAEDLANEEIVRRHEVATRHWNVNIHASEHMKHQRAVQDQRDTLAYIASTLTKLDNDLKRPCGLLDDGKAPTWRLDQTEGRNRMRLRLLPDGRTGEVNYISKRKHQDSVSSRSLRPEQSTPSSPANGLVSPAAAQAAARALDTFDNGTTETQAMRRDDSITAEEDFEMVDDPHDDGGGFEDKNRKVMRSLQRGDQVQQVYNVSRIVGLEACEGLLILGKESLYLLDNFFQRSDGEIVNVWQAPREERDAYLQMIAGREAPKGKPLADKKEHGARDWRWNDVISISKRRFLFRDVAIEIFFTDGQSYLLTALSPTLRNELYSKLVSRASHVLGNSASPHPEDAWRLDALRSHSDAPQTLGSKFVSVFNTPASLPATRRWIKGEMSNFHYLMLVNTMAGRTFNDLTQYPVFPWILADYTSEELDLENPRTFRDLSKPMGCQTGERQAEFRDRYQSFADMADHNAPPFHYGTHYSSAMIVASYLIRLQPFVQSYLLLQGGTFDHADRLFHSVERAWRSASRENMTDVRELIPEFFYLPAFLENGNGYDLGVTQGAGQSIDRVTLPPWANGDPHVFIAKHREALESPYVSRHLHQWIDLIFGSKQKGEAAVDATNVFHYLSYHGAKDLDHIEDPVERLATIGIIHNFGQTPHQVFPRAHPAREAMSHQSRRLDIAAASLIQLPFPTMETGERVTSLLYSSKLERLLCTTACRLNVPPNYDKYLEWGFADDSVRFYMTDSKKLAGLFEHLHQGQLSCAMFADSRTLITAGLDCTVSVWSVVSTAKVVDLQPRGCLFGHNAPVTTLAISRSISAILSASLDGEVFLWDLNRLEFVQKLCSGRSVECARISDITGNIMVCRGRRVSLFTLNGHLILSHDVCRGETDDYVVSCAFYEGTGDEWLERELLFTGHRHGVVNIWSKVIKHGKFELELVRRLDHVDLGKQNTSNTDASITCILPMAQKLYTGDEEGRVYEWDCVQRTTS